MDNPYPKRVSKKVLLKNLKSLLILRECYKSPDYYGHLRNLVKCFVDCPLCAEFDPLVTFDCEGCIWYYMYPKEVLRCKCSAFFKNSPYDFHHIKEHNTGYKPRKRRFDMLERQIKWTIESLCHNFKMSRMVFFKDIKLNGKILCFDIISCKHDFV
jgi:hypothetical protein